MSGTDGLPNGSKVLAGVLEWFWKGTTSCDTSNRLGRQDSICASDVLVAFLGIGFCLGLAEGESSVGLPCSPTK